VFGRDFVLLGAAVALRAAAIFAAVFAFDESSFVFCGTAVLDCEPRSSAAMAFSPASVNFNEYAWPVSSSRRQISIPDFALFSLTRPAFRSLAATFCVAAAFRVFGAMRLHGTFPTLLLSGGVAVAYFGGGVPVAFRQQGTWTGKRIT